MAKRFLGRLLSLSITNGSSSWDSGGILVLGKVLTDKAIGILIKPSFP
uniref:Uncharacterized protein n=1 Tax=Candidatus Kentrum sp. TC TaxID=2126339 RepID=A0A450Z519_9GAMM|nr:MAG: hypothetical protein BECKTC1821E_GA0114239_11421 [Candidatus Kentron sp. TC]